jgi:hypothetical protein
VAEQLRTYLPLMHQSVRPFVSSHDLASGTRWSAQLSKELDEAAFGIVCLTPDNLHSDWILFEAGALTKHVEGRACCLLLQNLGPADVAGPLAQFQNRVFSRSEVFKLLSDINALTTSPLPDSSLQAIFDKWWPDLEAGVAAALDRLGSTSAPVKRDSVEVLEEVLLRVRRLQARVDQVTPSLAITAMDVGASAGVADDRNADDQYFTVTFEPLRPGGPELLVRLDPYATFQMFLNHMYKFLAGYVPPSSYGTFWVFRDVETGELISHARMSATGPDIASVKDYRRLLDIGIRPGGKLKAVRIDDVRAA